MRKYLYLVLLFGLFSQAFALDPVEFEVIQRFPNGDGRGEFENFIVTTGGTGSEPSWPYGLTVSEELFYVDDYRNNRIVEFALNLDSWEEIPVFPSGQSLLKNDELMLTVDAESSFSIVNYREKQNVSSGRFVSNSQISGYMVSRSGFNYRAMVLAGDLLFAQVTGSDSGPQYHSFYIDENFSGRFEYRNPDQTIRFLKEDYEGTEEFTVDEDGYIFWNRRLVAPYGDSYARYHWNTT